MKGDAPDCLITVLYNNNLHSRNEIGCGSGEFGSASDIEGGLSNPSGPMLSASKHRLLLILFQSRSLSSSAHPQVLQIGSVLQETRVFSKDDIVGYSKVSWDRNPLHLDPKCALDSGFQDCLVHGMLVASLFPRVIASRFSGAVYVSQSLHFKLPVYVEEEVVGVVQAIHIREVKKKFMVKFSTKCFKSGDLIVIDGSATAVLPSLLLEQKP